MPIFSCLIKEIRIFNVEITEAEPHLTDILSGEAQASSVS